MSDNEVAAWQRRLEDTFGPNGKGGALWTEVPAKEDAYGAYVRTNAHGYIVLSNSFQTFFYSTLVACVSQYRESTATESAPYQPTFLLDCLTLFRSCRATNSLLFRGYPLDAYALLRDVVDRTLLLNAWALGLTNYKALNATQVLKDGASLDRDELSDKMRKAREQEQRRVLTLMIGTGSGLGQDTITWLRRWKSLFNLEVHGSRLTSAGEFGDWLRGKEALSIGPKPRSDSITTFINSASEVYWMILRILPFLQLSPGAFGTDWSERWKVLDESFDLYQAAFEALGKEMGTAVRRLVETHFTLAPESSYVEYSPDS